MTQPTTALIDRVRQNLEQVQSRIASAAASAGRSVDEIRLVGVSKYVGIAETAALYAAGCPLLGESRPQQLWEKASPSFEDQFHDATQPVEWHLIGHLQRNKVEKTVPLVTLIHGVDSERLLKAINQHASSHNSTSAILLEVNCSGDADKHGFTSDELKELVDRLDQFPAVKVKGLMTMAAREGGSEVARKNFAKLRKLRDQIASSVPHNVQFDELSMGMSGDFEEAIREGSTLVRVGSALWQGIL